MMNEEISPRGKFASVNATAINALLLAADYVDDMAGDGTRDAGDLIVGRVLRPYFEWFSTGKKPAPLTPANQLNDRINNMVDTLIVDQQGRAEIAEKRAANGSKGGKAKRSHPGTDDDAPPMMPRKKYGRDDKDGEVEEPML